MRYALADVNTVVRLPFVARMMRTACELNSTEWDVPELVGYSNDGARLYIDRGLQHWSYIGESIDIKRFLLIRVRALRSLHAALKFADRDEINRLMAYLLMTSVADDPKGHCADFAATCEEYAVTLQHGDTGLNRYQGFIAAESGRAAVGTHRPPDLVT